MPSSAPAPSMPKRPPCGRAQQLTPQEIAELVTPELLCEHLDFPANRRTRRANCPLPLCTGDSKFTLSFARYPVWHCFRCLFSGDSYALIMNAIGCDFPEALRLMAKLAGVKIGSARRRDPELQRRRREERGLTAAAEQYAALERATFLDCARRLRQLDQTECFAAACLQRGADGDPEGGDALEFWWDGLARIYTERWWLLASWLLVGFGTADQRQQFVLYPRRRSTLVAAVLDGGGLQDDRGLFWGLPS